MHSLPESWHSLLAKLRFTKKGNRKKTARTGFRRRIQFESLEGRQMLSITVNTVLDELDGSITDGDVSIRDAVALASPGETIVFGNSLAVRS